MVVHRHCPDRAGHDAPEHGIITPAPACSCPRPHFAFPDSPSSLATPAAIAEHLLASAVAIAVRKPVTSRPFITTAAPLAPQQPTTSSRVR